MEVEMVIFLVILAIVVGTGGYLMYRAQQPPALPEADEPTPLPEPVVETAPEPAPEPSPEPEIEPILLIDPLSGEQLEEDSIAVNLPLRGEFAPGYRAFKRVFVNRKSGNDYRKFGPTFFRDTMLSMSEEGYSVYCEEDDMRYTLESSSLFSLMFGEDFSEDDYEDRCDDLESYYEENLELFESERHVVEEPVEVYDELTEDDIIEVHDLEREMEDDASATATAAVATAMTLGEIAKRLEEESVRDSNNFVIVGTTEEAVELEEALDVEAVAKKALTEAAAPLEVAVDSPIEDSDSGDADSDDSDDD